MSEMGSYAVEAKKGFQTKGGNDKPKREFINKKNVACDYCKKKGHSMEFCFKLDRVPDLVKELNDKKFDVHVNCIQEGSTSKVTQEETNPLDTLRVDVQMMRNEMWSVMGKLTKSRIAFNDALIEYLGHLSSNIFSSNNKFSWLIGSGVSYHVATDRELFDSIEPLNVKPSLYLPDGYIRRLEFSGSMHILITLF